MSSPKPIGRSAWGLGIRLFSKGIAGCARATRTPGLMRSLESKALIEGPLGMLSRTKSRRTECQAGSWRPSSAQSSRASLKDVDERGVRNTRPLESVIANWLDEERICRSPSDPHRRRPRGCVRPLRVALVRRPAGPASAAAWPGPPPFQQTRCPCVAGAPLQQTCCTRARARQRAAGNLLRRDRELDSLHHVSQIPNHAPIAQCRRHTTFWRSGGRRHLRWVPHRATPRLRGPAAPRSGGGLRSAAVALCRMLRSRRWASLLPACLRSAVVARCRRRSRFTGEHGSAAQVYIRRRW